MIDFLVTLLEGLYLMVPKPRPTAPLLGCGASMFSFTL